MKLLLNTIAPGICIYASPVEQLARATLDYRRPEWYRLGKYSA